jgi:tetratricopeptide (TPR) repeat protein
VRNFSAFSTRFGVRTRPSRVGSSPSSTSKRRIISCIVSFYLLCFAPFAAAQDPDALYADREHLESATQAEAIWAARLASNPNDFESAWKLARARYWLGTNGLPEDQRRKALEAGVEAGRIAAKLRPDRPEGHFWMAANMGALAESFGLRQGLRYRGAIRDALEQVLKIDPAFQQGSADRALGRWYYKVPGLFGGDKKKSEEHLRKALAYNPNSVITHLFLAETLIELDREDEARKELEAAINAPEDPEWAPEDRRFRARAKELLAKLK